MTCNTSIHAIQKRAAKRRKVSRNRKILVMFFIVLAAVLYCSVIKAKGIEEKNTVIITVQSGDTLWSIASGHRKSGEDIRKVIKDIKEINKLNSSIIHAGDILILP